MRFLCCSLESPGFLYPSIGMAKTLSSRGHEVMFVAAPAVAEIVRREGLELAASGAGKASGFRVAQWTDPRRVVLQVRQIEEALERFEPDALIGQPLTLGPLAVAERRDLPLAVMGFGTYLWPVADHPVPGQEKTGIGRLRGWRYAETLKHWNLARAELGLPPQQPACRESPWLGDLFWVRSVPELEPESENLPEQAHLVGSCLWEPEEVDPELDDWLGGAERAGKPVIYAQHGRFFHIPGFWRQLVEALDARGYLLAASVSRLDEEIGELPEGFLIRPHLPQGRVLKVARAVVASANTTAVLGALCAGVPALLIPGGGEQPDIAEVCRSAGVAKTLKPGEATAANISRSVEELLEDSRYRERAALCRRAFLKVDSFERVAELLEILAQTRQPVLREAVVEPAALGA